MNLNFIKKFNPLKVVLLGVFLWVLIFTISSVRVKELPGIMPVLLVCINYLFLIFGIYITKRNYLNNEFDENSKITVLKKILTYVIIISVIGFCFRLLDKFYLREITIGNSSYENRKLLSNNKSSIFGVLAAVLMPFSFIPLFIWLKIRIKVSKIRFLLYSIIFFFPAFDSIVLGSRSGLFIVFFLYLIYIFYFKVFRFTPFKIIVYGFLIYFLGLFTTKMFIERTMEYMVTEKKAVNHILSNAVYNFTLEPKEDTRKSILETKNETVKLTRLSLLNAAQYYTHGFFEFSYLYNNYEGSYHFGQYTFGVIVKFSNIIFGTNVDLEKIQNSPVRVGVYSTFFGPIFLDFGWFSPLFMLIFGILQGKLYNKVINGAFRYIPLLFYILVVDFFMPVINFIVSSQGIYIILAMIFFAKGYKFLTYKLVFKDTNGARKYFRILK